MHKTTLRLLLAFVSLITISTITLPPAAIAQQSGGGGSGLPATSTSGLCLQSTGSGSGAVWGSCAGSTSSNWSSLVPGTGSITAGTYSVPTGATLTFTGTGIVNANQINSLVFPTLVSSDCLTNNGTTLSWGACGSTITFQANGTGLSSSSTVNFQNSAAFNGLTVTFANPSAGNVQLGLSGTLGNSGLTNSTITIAGTSVALGGSTSSFPSPGAIGGTTPSTGAFTTLSASSTVSGTGFSTYLASPPAIGGTLAAAGTFSALTDTALTGGPFCVQQTAGVLSSTGSACGSGGGAGTVTTFSAGNLSPLFTSSVATATSTPALTFSLSNAAANSVYGNATGSSAAPGFTANPAVTSLTTVDATNAGLLSLTGNTTNPAIGSNIVGLLAPASASFTSYAIQFPSTAPSGTQYLGCGTPSSNVSACTWNTVSAGGVSSVTGDGVLVSNSGSTGAVTLTLANAGAGTVLANAGTSAATPSYTSTPVLGKSGTVGTIGFGNATSGVVTLGAVAGALGTVTASLPANTGTIAELNLAQTWTAVQALGSSTATTQSAGDATTAVATDAFVSTAISNAIAAVNPAVAVLAASTAGITGTYIQVGGGIGDTFTVTATGAFTLDGIAINTIGQRILLKNQTTASQNGVYTATIVGTTGISPVFTRALDYDTPSDVNNTGSIPVQSGTANASTSWLLTSQVTSIGSSGSSLTYGQFTLNPSTLVTHTAGALTATHIMLGNGGADSTVDPSSTSDGAGDLTAVLYSTSGINGGITGTEGTCAGLTPAIGVDLLCPSSTGGPLGAHGWVKNVNNAGWTTLGATAAGNSGDIQMNSGSGGNLAASHLNDGGTNANLITATETIMLQTGTSSTPALIYGSRGTAGASSFWGYSPANFQWCMNASGDTCDLFFNDTGQFIVAGANANNCFGFSSSASNAQTADTCIRRLAPAVVQVGSGTNADESALLRDGDTCRITADVSLTVNTANSFCSWSLPNVSVTTRPWAWQCSIIWAITAGTGTNTLSLGVNASQTPASTTNAAATIYTTQTGTQTQGVAALSASGALNVLTSPTYTPAATLEQANASGTFVPPTGSTGTFAVTATAAGTTATAAIKAGSVCVLQ